MEIIIGIVIVLALTHFVYDVIYNKPLISGEINPKALAEWMKSQEVINKQFIKCLKDTESTVNHVIEQHNNLARFAESGFEITTRRTMRIGAMVVCRTQKMRQLDFTSRNSKKTKWRKSICLTEVSARK